MGALIVKSVRHFVPYYHADSAVIERVVRSCIEVRGLEYAGGKADFVGRRVIICVDSLWRHVPLIFVYGLPGVIFYLLVVAEQACAEHVFKQRETRVDGEFCIVLPFVRVTYLDVKRCQFLERSRLCRVAHPRLRLYSFPQRLLQICHESLHALLARLGEVALAIDLS